MYTDLIINNFIFIVSLAAILCEHLTNVGHPITCTCIIGASLSLIYIYIMPV